MTCVKDKKMSVKEMERATKEGSELCENHEEIHGEWTSNDLKLLTRGALPIGMTEEIEKIKEGSEMETMDALWRTLASKVDEKNNNQIEIAEDKHAIERMENLTSHADEIHRLSNLLSADTISKVKKRSCK